MKIDSITHISATQVITDESEFNEYIRYGQDCWYIRMGESEEPVYNSIELERLYQEYISTLRLTQFNQEI
jgi:hypothetical protein